MRTLATNAGFEVVEAGTTLFFYDRGARGLGIACAVTSGLAALLWFHAALWTLLSVSDRGGDWRLGLGLAAAALVPTTIALLTRRAFVRARTRPLDELQPLLALDRAAGCLRGPNGQPLAPLAHCRAARGMLISSSAPSVQISWPSGACEVYRGTLFGGDIGDMLAILHGVGLR